MNISKKIQSFPISKQPPKLSIKRLVDGIERPSPEFMERLASMPCLLIEADAPYKATAHAEPGVVAAELDCDVEDVLVAMATGETVDGDWFCLQMCRGLKPVYVPAADRMFTTPRAAQSRLGKYVEFIPIEMPGKCKLRRRDAVRHIALELGGEFDCKTVLASMPFATSAAYAGQVLKRMADNGELRVVGKFGRDVVYTTELEVA